MKKTSLPLNGWLKEVAPSVELRQWFNHDPEKWLGFRRRYFAELERNREAWELLLRDARRGQVTLIYSSRDEEHNAAVALRDFLETASRKKRPPSRNSTAS